MDGRQHSATVVLPHPLHNQMSLRKLWVAKCRLASASATFATKAARLRNGLIKIWIHSNALLASKNMDDRQHSATGVLPHPFQYQMLSIHKLWIANCCLSSTSATCSATVAARLRYGLMEILSLSKALLASKDKDGRQHST